MLIASIDCMSQCEKANFERVLLGIDVSASNHLESFEQFRKREIKVFQEYLNDANVFVSCGNIKVVITEINELGSNEMKTIEVYIPKRTPQKQMKKYSFPFYKYLNHQLSKYSEANYKNVPKTLLYQPICTFLNQSVNAKEKQTIILFTDGIENNQLFSLNSNTVISSETALIKMEESCGCKLPARLDNLRVIFISYRFYESDLMITRAVNVFKEIFESRGAKFYSGASLEKEYLN